MGWGFDFQVGVRSISSAKAVFSRRSQRLRLTPKVSAVKSGNRNPNLGICR